MPSLIPYYQECAIIVIPCRIARGARIKILEASSYRRPVVSTLIGAEGFKVLDNKHCILRNHLKQFANECIRLLTDFNKMKELTDDAYSLVKNEYDINHIEKLIANEILDV